MLLESARQALTDAGLVQSFSGVRTSFGHGPDITAEHEALAILYGFCYARIAACGDHCAFIVGRDPRPTGAALSRALVRGFLAGADSVSRPLKIVDLGIITTPLAQTAVRSLDADGGVIVTASHNPITHNGFKFLSGCNNTDSNSAPAGALLSADQMAEVISTVSATANDEDAEYAGWVKRVDDHRLTRELGTIKNELSRVKAERAYLDSIGADWGITPHCLKPLTLGPVLLDPNGGSGCGIDARVLEHFGVRVIEINAEVGYPEHAIDTDGIDPASGKHTLLRVSRAVARERAHFGVAFDYDADRGNLVLPGRDESAVLHPQIVATFNIAVALARRAARRRSHRLLGVVMSDATSLASQRVAEAFDAEVFLVETGEINVVTRMHELRQEGYDVPVGVEGANGGTIFETSTCRDGLQAALSAALAESETGLAEAWARAFGAAEPTKRENEEPSLQELISLVPANRNIITRVTCPPVSHGAIKASVEQGFADTLWPKLQSRFERYEFQNFEGTRVVAKRSGDESGGWRVFMETGNRRAFIFLRGSKTEAGVWRMIVDTDDPADFDAVREAADGIAALACNAGQ